MSKKDVEKIAQQAKNDAMVGMKPGEPKTGIVTNCKNLNVRKEPDTSADVLEIIPVETEVMVDENESTDEFYKVFTSSGMEGFCMKKYITI